MKALYPVVELVGRVLLSVIFITSGWGKIGAIAGTQGYMEMMGVPGILIYPTILVEVVGGLFVLVGYQTRVAAVLLAGFSLVSGFLFHFDPSNQMEMISFMKNVTIAGGFLVLVAHGAGKISVDAKLAR